MPGLNYGNKYCMSSVEKSRIKPRKSSEHKVYIFNECEKFLYSYSTEQVCCELENLKLSTLKLYIKNRKLYKEKYFSYNKILQPNPNIF